jgi:hypothetical protein
MQDYVRMVQGVKGWRVLLKEGHSRGQLTIWLGLKRNKNKNSLTKVEVRLKSVLGSSESASNKASGFSLNLTRKVKFRTISVIMLLSWDMNMRSLKTLICLEYILNLAIYLLPIELNLIVASSYFFYLNRVISLVMISKARTIIWSICFE